MSAGSFLLRERSGDKPPIPKKITKKLGLYEGD